MTDEAIYPLSKDGITALKKICYEYNSHPSDSMVQLWDTIACIEGRIGDLEGLKKEEALSENDALLLKILVEMKSDLDTMWNAASLVFEGVSEIFGSLERGYFSEALEESAFKEYLDEVLPHE